MIAKDKPPLRPKQITLEELQGVQLPVKVRYCHGNSENSKRVYTITALDVPNRRAKVFNENKDQYIYLSDCCVVPYEGGNWNQWNWLEFTEDMVRAEIVLPEPMYIPICVKLPRT